ncbi:Carboxylic ester hydrolase [Mycena venus]|uniref:Carboxylic ester hydrolase n=1 Tax=Mycena venus TaxID=2733690 RepID=A0A8H6XXS8_9AGAR|nr:Carboxylic ester hydrolase [Mycena venus]
MSAIIINSHDPGFPEKASESDAHIAPPVLVPTTSGLLQGVQDNGLKIFKGIRFGHPASGELRWEPPVPFTSTTLQNATQLGPACVQQFPFGPPSGALAEFLFNNPADPPRESEDCLFLNVWAPVSARKQSVLVWIYGGSLAFGTGSLPLYDGVSLALNQDIVVVTFNYRTNVFGFPRSPELPLSGNNLGFLDQELALKWVQDNIAQFGGDPRQVTIMGQSAGAESVGTALTRHTPADAPFRAGILLSGAQPSTSPVPSFDAFNLFAAAMGCSQDPGPARLSCLRQVPASTIRNFTNSQFSLTYGPLVDNTTFFADPLLRIRTGLTARVPFIIGSMQDDGSFFALGQPDLADWLNETFAGVALPPAFVRSLYTPGLNDSQVISEIYKDFLFQCPAQLWGSAAVSAGIPNVYRYVYGAVFADLQSFPGAGAWHSSELFGIFGNYNTSTATAPEVELFKTMQTTIGNYIKNPTVSPALNWPTYVPGNSTATVAMIAFSDNVRPNDFIQLQTADSIDGPCNALWDAFLDVRV